MIPLKDENPVQITPYVTYILIAINILAFGYELSLNPQQLEAFFQVFAIVPRELTASFSGVPSEQAVPDGNNAGGYTNPPPPGKRPGGGIKGFLRFLFLPLDSTNGQWQNNYQNNTGENGESRP